MGLGCPSLLESRYLVNSDMDYKMADMNFLLHCVDWIRNLSDRQHNFVDIHVGDLNSSLIIKIRLGKIELRVS